MSWMTESGDHEGYAATLVADGRRVVIEQASEMELDDGTRVPEAETAGWQTYCTCGWRAPMTFERVTDPALARRPNQVYDATGGPAPEWVEQMCHAEWLEHVRPQEDITWVKRAALELSAADARLDRAVAAARQSGTSWADIAREVGISRQSAHERWRHL
ncbi:MULTISPECIES: AsnC family protein [unclassified Rhodococcus (in: high G+C Gram-positive bacteria)]|uniref:AsnC family protein n=1 Tax=unclassified Rhodococcus (in: high G+C Gram-positive bacteria) TaxID=192944 RepID=UPI0002FBB422|nr:AsnC family protein [Rhodococcus sp. DK17]